MTYCHNSQINCRQLQLIEWISRRSIIVYEASAIIKLHKSTLTCVKKLAIERWMEKNEKGYKNEINNFSAWMDETNRWTMRNMEKINRKKNLHTMQHVLSKKK